MLKDGESYPLAFLFILMAVAWPTQANTISAIVAQVFSIQLDVLSHHMRCECD